MLHAVGALLRDQRYEKKYQDSIDYLPWFHAKFFIRFGEEGQYKPKTTVVLTFLVCFRMSSLSFVQRTFDWDGWNGFVRRGKCRDLGAIGPQVSMPSFLRLFITDLLMYVFSPLYVDFLLSYYRSWSRQMVLQALACCRLTINKINVNKKRMLVNRVRRKNFHPPWKRFWM